MTKKQIEAYQEYNYRKNEYERWSRESGMLTTSERKEKAAAYQAMDDAYNAYIALKDQTESASPVRGMIESLEVCMGIEVKESLNPLKGRTTDARQQLNMDRSYRGTSPSGWLVIFPEDLYPSSTAYMGPVPIALVGHEDMTSDEFANFMYDAHAGAYPRTTPQVAVATQANESSVDLRRLIRGGDYDRSVQAMCPGSHQAMTGIVTLLDDINNHPIAQQGLRKMKEAGTHSFKDLAISLRRLASELEEPAYNKHTLGNVLDNLSFPFGTSGIA